MANLAYGSMHISIPTIKVRKMRNCCSELCSYKASCIFTYGELQLVLLAPGLFFSGSLFHPVVAITAL